MLRESLDGSKLSTSCPPTSPTKEDAGLRGRGRSASTAPSGEVPLPCTTIRREKHRVRADRRLRIQISLLHSPNYLPVQRAHSSQCCHTGHGHAAGSVVEGDSIPTLSSGLDRPTSCTGVLQRQRGVRETRSSSARRGSQGSTRSCRTPRE